MSNCIYCCTHVHVATNEHRCTPARCLWLSLFTGISLQWDTLPCLLYIKLNLLIGLFNIKEMAISARFSTLALALSLLQLGAVNSDLVEVSADDLMAGVAEEDCFEGNCCEDGLAALSLAQLRATVLRKDAASKASAPSLIGESDLSAAIAGEDAEGSGVAFYQTAAKLDRKATASRVSVTVDADGNFAGAGSDLRRTLSIVLMLYQSPLNREYQTGCS
ncbi:unnamed protein product [Polarella glacialis]|uniref:Uncharacterized protein n=1 Tax=Polarella glacialis TaxID=89957 RepID=A0A813JRW0_POLGL|nr:unnamed protein product [Polarella glacialis]